MARHALARSAVAAPAAAWPEVQRGRHGLHRVPPRRGRRLTAWAATLSAVVVAVAAAAAGYVDLDGRPPRPVGPVTGQAGGVSASASPGRQPVAATPQGMLALLTELLPAGKVSEPAGHRGRDLIVDVRFDRGEGSGRVRVILGPDLDPGQLAARACTADEIREECRLRPDGTIVHLRVGRGCLQDHVTDVDRPDGSQVRIEVGDCVDGRRPPRSRSASPPPDVLSPGEAELIAVDGRWGRRMDPDLVAAGRRDFPHLGTVADPDRPVLSP